MPSQESPGIKTYGDSLLTTLQKHFGEPKAAKTLDGTDCTKAPIIVSDETEIEWQNYI